ncbi:hypothetical protein AAVH_32439 [Aphelenchoides avenae]|nr:hypothetical protein AAVH_32439 [Aphelenchus avenae]
MNSADCEELKVLGESKRVLVILVKWRHPFLTKLEDFHKPEDAGLIGVFAEQIRPKFLVEHSRFFDKIFWFKADYSTFDSIFADANATYVPDVTDHVRCIAASIPLSKLRLVESEVFLLDQVCRLRKELGITGPLAEQLECLHNKAILKKLVSDAGIPTAKFSVVAVPLDDSVANVVDGITLEIGTYPLFRKPTYLVEQCLHGREFWAFVCLLPDGTWQPMFVHCAGNILVRDCLESGTPIPFVGRRFEDWEDEFPNLLHFVGLVIEALKPPHPHIFSVQGIQEKHGTDSYVFVECAHRQGGARGTKASYTSSGVSMETALISCHLNPAYQTEPDPKWPRLAEGILWYPFREGVLRSQNALALEELSSEVEVTWLVEPGTKLCKAESFAHFLVSVRVTNENWHSAMRDLEWIAHNWKPYVVPQ